MIIEVFPGQGIDQIKFGYSRKNIHEILKVKPFQFKKSPWSKTLTDSYDDLGFQLFYDGDDNLEFVEILQQCKFKMFNIDLRKMKVRDILDLMKNKTNFDDMKEMDGAYIFNELGFGVQTNGRSIQSYFIFGSGKYYKIIEVEKDRAECYFNNI